MKNIYFNILLMLAFSTSLNAELFNAFSFNNITDIYTSNSANFYSNYMYNNFGLYTAEINDTNPDKAKFDNLESFVIVKLGADYTFDATVTNPGDFTDNSFTYLWSDGSTNSTLKLTEGNYETKTSYSVTVKNSSGFEQTKDINIYYIELDELKDATICSGSTHTFNASITKTNLSDDTSFTYAWITDDMNGVNISDKPEHNTILTNEKLTISVDYNGNLYQLEYTVNLTILDLEVISPSQQTICGNDGDTYILETSVINYTDDITYSWYFDEDEISGENNKDITIDNSNGGANGTYRVDVEYTDEISKTTCYSSSKTEITFEKKLNMTTGNLSVCSGDDVVFKDFFEEINFDDLLVVKWEKTSKGIISTDKDFEIKNIQLSDNANYTATFITQSGCEYSKDFEITVTDAPDFYIDNAKEFCKGGSTLKIIYNNPGTQDESNDTYKWYYKKNNTTERIGITPSINNTEHDISTTGVGRYFVEILRNGSCATTEQTEIFTFLEFSNLKDETISVCEGDDVEFNGILFVKDIEGIITPLEGSTYKWVGPNSYENLKPEINLNNVKLTEAGVYKVTATSISGCTYYKTVTLIVTPKPVFNLGNDVALCDGNANIELNIENYNSAYTYNYKLINNKNSNITEGKTKENNKSFTVTTPATYTLKVWVEGENTCTNSDKIIIGTTQTIDTKKEGATCEGDGYIVLISKLKSDIGTQNSTWEWKHNGNTLTGSYTTNGNYNELYIPANLSNIGEYTLTVTNGGCTMTKDFTVTLNPTIEASVPDIDFCKTGTTKAELTINNIMSNEEYIINLSAGGKTVDGYPNNITNPNNPYLLNIPAPGYYTVTISSENQCDNYVEFFVGNPKINVVAKGYPSCEEAGTVTAFVKNNISLIERYYWTKADDDKGSNSVVYPVNDQNADTKIITPDSYKDYGYYTAHAVLENGCELISEPVLVAIYPIPKFTLGDLALCGESATVELDPLFDDPEIRNFPGFKDFTYTWVAGKYRKYHGEITPGTENTPKIEISKPGSYELTITTPAGCTYSEKPTGIIREILKVTPVGFICSNKGETTHDLHAVVEQGRAKEYYWSYDGDSSEKSYSGYKVDGYYDYATYGSGNWPKDINGKFLKIDESGTYKSVVLTYRGCWLTYQADVEDVIEDYQVNINLNGNEGLCLAEGNNQTITAVVNNLPSPAYYFWYKDGVIISGEIGKTLNVTESGTYKVIVTTENNVESSCPSNEATVVIGGSNKAINILGDNINECYYYETIIGTNGKPEVVLNGNKEIVIGSDLKTLTGADKKTKVSYIWYKYNETTTNWSNLNNSTWNYVVTENGKYKVEANVGGCEYVDEIEVVIEQQSYIEIEPITNTCENTNIILSAKSTDDGISINSAFIKWYKLELNGTTVDTTYIATGNNATANTEGRYLVEYNTNGGCSISTDEINFKFSPTPILKPIADIAMCENLPVIVNINLSEKTDASIKSGINYYLYNSNDNTKTVLESINAGETTDFKIGALSIGNYNYYVIAEYNGCQSTAVNFNVTVTGTPTEDLGADVIMCNPTHTLTAKTNNANYTWYKDGNVITDLNGNNVSSKSITIYEIGTYGLKVELNGCEANYEEINLIKSGSNTTVLGNEITICNNEIPYIIDASALNMDAKYFKWYNTNDSLNTIATGNKKHNTSTSGEYKLVVDDNLGCIYEEIFNLNILETLDPITDLGLQDNYINCSTDVLEIIPNKIEGITYQWKVKKQDGRREWIKGDKFILKDKYKNAIYYKVKAFYTEDDNSKCLATNKWHTFTIDNNTTPEFTISQYGSCDAVNIEINKTSADNSNITYVWYKNDVEINPTTKLTLNNITTSGTIKIIATYTNPTTSSTCNFTVEQPIVVNDANTNLVVDNITLCNGESEFIDLTVPTAIAYIFNGKNIETQLKLVPSNFEITKEMSYRTGGKSTIKIITDLGCTYIEDIKVTNNNINTIISNKTVCLDEDIKLDLTLFDSNHTAHWTLETTEPATGKIITEYKTGNSADNGAINHIVKGKTKVTILIANKDSTCTKELISTINIHSEPSALIPDYEMCNGDEITLDAKAYSLINGNGDNIEGVKYSWVDGNNKVLTNAYDNNTKLDVTVSGIYRVHIQAPQCNYYKEVNVTTNPLPSFDLGTDEEYAGCLNEKPVLNIDLNAKITDKFTPEELALVTYKWEVSIESDGNFKDIEFITGNKYTVETKGTYRVTASTAKSCSHTDNIFINYGLAPTFYLGDDIKEECITDFPVLDISINSTELSQSDITEYQWEFKGIKDDDFSILTSQINRTITANKVGTYRATATAKEYNGNICDFSDEIKVDFNRIPEVEINDFTNEECTETLPTLTAWVNNKTDIEADGGKVIYQWQWKEKDTDSYDNIPGATNADYTVDKSGYYQINVSNFIYGENKCIVKTKTKLIKYAPKPTVTINTPTDECNNAQTLTAEVENKDSFTNQHLNYQWSFKQPNETVFKDITGATNKYITANKDGWYKATVYSTSSSTSNTVICSNFNEVEFNYKPLPEIIVTGTNISPCSNKAQTITVNINNTQDWKNGNGQIEKYEWYKNNVLVKTTTTNALTDVYSITETNKYKVVVTTVDGCTAEDEKDYEYEATPIFSLIVSNNNDKCTSEPITITANITNDNGTFGAFTYNWVRYYKDANGNDQTLNLDNHSAEITVTENGTYSLIGVPELTSCNSAEVTSGEISFKPIPEVDINFNAEDFLCSDTPQFLTAEFSNGAVYNTDFTYKWYKNEAEITTGINYEKHTLEVNQSGEYKIVVENECGTFEDTKEVVYTNKPEITVSASNNENSCTKEDLILTVKAENGTDITNLNFKWFYIDADNKSEYLETTSAPNYTITKAGKYSVQAFDTKNNCNSAEVTINVNYQPTPIILSEVILPTDKCSGEDIIINATLVNNHITFEDLTYVWTLPNNTTDKTSGLSIIANQSGEYTLTATTKYGCNDTTKQTIKYYPIYSNLAVNITGNANECTSTATTLTANVEGDYSGTILYKWFKGNNTTGETNKTISVTESNEYEVEISIKDDNCNVASDKINVNYLLEPTVVLNANTPTGCTEEAITLTADVTPTTLTDLTYLWTLSDGSTKTTKGINTIKVFDNGNYKVQVSTPEFCSGTDETVISEYKPNPIISSVIKGPNNECSNDDITIIATLENKNKTDFKDIKYTWTVNGNKKPAYNGLTTITATENGEYILTADFNDCKATTTENISIKPIYTDFDVKIEGNSDDCTTSEITLEAKVTGTYTGNVLYQWQLNEEDISGATSKTISVTESGNFTINVSIENDVCNTTNDMVVVNYNPEPIVEITVNNLETDCMDTDTQVTLTADITNSTILNINNLIYKWTLPNGDTETITTNKISIKESGKYIVEVSDKTGASICTGTDEVEINYFPEPKIDYSVSHNNDCNSTPITINTWITNDTFNFGTVTYQWYKNNVELTDKTETNITVEESDIYKLIVTAKHNDTVICTSFIEKEINYNPIPEMYIEVDGELAECSINEITLIAKIKDTSKIYGDVTYTWKQDGSIIEGEITKELIIHTSGLYTVEAVTENGNCSSANIAEKQIDYTPAPRLNVTHNVPKETCTDEQFTITAKIENPNEINLDYTLLTWELPNGETKNGFVDDDGVATLKVTQKGIYKVTAIDYFTYCSSTENVIDIDFRPLADFVLNYEGIQEECTPLPFYLTIDIPDNDIIFDNIKYFWTKPDNTTEEIEISNDEIGTTIKKQISQSGNHKIEVRTYYNDTEFCTNGEKEIDVEYKPLPIIYTKIEGLVNACTQEEVKLNAIIDRLETYNNTLIYSWYLDGDVIPNQNETILTVHKSGEYIFMAETTDGCTASDTVNVDYRPEAKIIPRIEGTIHICTTEPVTIHADINDNIPKEDVAFIWTKPDGTVIANYYESSLVVTQSGTYKVSSIATNGGAEACLSDDAEITIDFKPVPNIELNLSADAKNCSTNPIMLEVGITDLSINYGELTYFWTTPYTAPNEFITTTKPTLEALAKGTYTVYAENKHGCPSNSSNYDVTILPQPKVVINTEGEKELCSISYPTLSADLTNGDIDYGNLSYIWKHSETKDGTYTLITDGIEKELIIDKNGWYSVVVNTEKGCESEQAITYIYYEIKPDITLSIKNETTECTDEPVILTIDAGNSENLTFLWEVPYGTGKVLTTENTLTVHKTGKYTVTAYTTDGCSSNPISEDVVYNRNPKIELVIDGTVDKCTAIGDVKLLVDFDNAKDSAAYQNLVYTWTTPYNGIVTTKVPVLKVNQNGTYKVKVTTENNCDGYSEEINVNFMPNPEVFLVTDDINSICTNEEVYIEAYTVDIDESMTLEYTWTTPSNKTIITDVAKIKALENGIYKVEVSNIFDKLNCNSKEATIPVSYLPKPLANIEAQNITCSTDQATLTANITNIVEILNRADNITYQWWRTDLEYNGSAEMIEEGTVIDSIEGVPTLSISKDGKYDIILIANYPTSSTYPDGKKCDELISETINVSPMPLITMNIPTASDCHDYGTTITVNLDNYEILNDANEIETLTYTWLIDGVTELNYNEDSLRVSLLGNHSYQVIVSTPEGCVATADVEDFNYKPSPSIELTDLIETCEYDTPLLDPVINADIDPTLIKYTWTNKSGTVLQQGIGEKFRTYIDENIGEIVNIQSFTYNLKTEYEGCINTADVVVTYNPEPEFDLPESIQLCEGESVKIVADKSPYNNAVISWFSTNIKDSIISDEITVSEIGTYHATATLGECVYSSSVEVDILKYPKFRIETPSFNCNEKTLSLVAIPFNIDDTYTYKWSNGTNSDVTEINSGGEYIVEASNGKCSVSKSVYIKDQYFDTSNSINSVGFCVGGSTELTPEYDYESIIWNDGSTKPTLFVDKAGTYTAKAVNSFGCEDELIFEVYVDNGPEINNVEVNENNILVTVNEGVSPYRFFIENKEYYPALNNGKYEIENNFTEGNHIITVIDYNECDATNEFLIKDKMTTIDILSPNGDGVNDTWHVKELELYPKSMVRIYDRYGRLVHKVPGIDLNWDGRFEGNLLPASDYWYHIDLYADGKITYTGHFSLIR